MLKLTHHPAQIEHSICRFHPFQIDHDYPKTIAKEDICWCHIAVNKHLPIFPHAALANPMLFELLKRVDLVVPNAPCIEEV